MPKISEDHSFEEIVEFIRGQPQTFYPQLLTELVESAYKKDVFLPGGASRFIKNVEKRIGKKEGTGA